MSSLHCPAITAVDLDRALETGWRQAGELLSRMFPVDLAFGEPTVEHAVPHPADHPATQTVRMRFTGPASGCAALIIQDCAARELTASALGPDASTPDRMAVLIPSLVVELGNVALNAVVGRLPAVARRLDFSVPEIVGDSQTDALIPSDWTAGTVCGSLSIGEQEPTQLRILLGVEAEAV